MKLRHLFAALLLSALPVTAAQAGFSITIAPPPLLTYEQPICPTEGYLWTPGYWNYDYDAGDYYWVNGVWVPPPRVGYLWTPGYWGFNNGFYAFNEGYWGPSVGFYGGINYGYGYGGYGYYGGRWDGRVFRYNTAITRVNANNVHNTYVDRNAIHNATQSRTSFNGRGGINARPDARQQAVANASHLNATAVQTKAIQQAKTGHHANPGGPRPNNRSRTANVTPNGRTNNAQRNPQITRSNPSMTNPTRSNGPSNRTGATRQSPTGRDRTAITRGSGSNAGRSPSRGPQVTRQAKAPQPKGGGHPKGDDKKH